jgi:hypothetical protein
VSYDNTVSDDTRDMLRQEFEDERLKMARLRIQAAQDRVQMAFEAEMRREALKARCGWFCCSCDRWVDLRRDGTCELCGSGAVAPF